jgi:hypothetical protein
MVNTDIPVAKPVEMSVTYIIGTHTLIQVPKCSIEGKHCTQMKV